MYQATIFEDSPLLTACRKLLTKQRLAWDEERVAHATERKEGSAILIVCHNTEAKMKPVRNQRKVVSIAQPAYKCQKIEGGYLWETPTGKKIFATFAHDERAMDRIKRETQSRIDKTLVSDFTDAVGKSLGNRDFSPFFK